MTSKPNPNAVHAATFQRAFTRPERTPDGKSTPARRGQSLPTTYALRRAIDSFRKLPAAGRPAAIAEINAAADRLGATGIGWYRGWRFRHDPTYRAPEPQPRQRGPLPNPHSIHWSEDS